MEQELRTVRYDADLNIEVYNFKGIMQKFPNHFHEYYVIGFIESGQRYLSCKNKEYIIEPGDLLLFNPHDNHTCEQIDGRTLEYCCINIQPERMSALAYELTGNNYLPHFTEQVIFHSELISTLRELHIMIMQEDKGFKKEELFLFLIEQLIRDYANPVAAVVVEAVSSKVDEVCEFIEKNYTRNITLDELSDLSGFSKYYLLRSFTKHKGITPYSYLETIRIESAKKLLENGATPIAAALQTGFTDQSHFSNFFKRFIGLTPKQYRDIFQKR